MNIALFSRVLFLSGVTTHLIDLSNELIKKGHNVYIFTAGAQNPDPLLAKLDISKTESELGYIQAYSYVDSLIDFKKEMESEPFSLLWGRKEDYIEEETK
ncbi:hypothetical protein MOSL_1213 [Moraxella osloensis]|nr:hypothetical protein MOSL_1213 [Moraxella osloensis]